MDDLFLTSERRLELQKEGKKVADVLFSTPGWEETVAKRISQYVELSRSEPSAELTDKVKQLRSAHPEWTMQEAEVYEIVQRDQTEKTQPARQELRKLLDALAGLKDSRTIPLIAPVLRENSFGVNGGDYHISPPQDYAAKLLGELASNNVIEAPERNDPKWMRDRSEQINYWRYWWRTNHGRFSPVPEPLRVIDERRGPGTAEESPLPPAPLSTPRSTSPAPVAPPSAPSIPTSTVPERSGYGLAGTLTVLACLLVAVAAIQVLVRRKNR